jgi:hypothetical protein
MMKQRIKSINLDMEGRSQGHVKSPRINDVISINADNGKTVETINKKEST